ncbi:hypothetical protein JWH04_07675, partial [Xanthomonas melonis]|nr:hypothetical protein [Xanthomonas melonis]
MRWQMWWVAGGVSWRLRVVAGDGCSDVLLQRHGTACEPAAQGVRQRTELATQRMRVSADVKLTHSAEVKVTHLGHDGGLLKAADVDSGAGSG